MISNCKEDLSKVPQTNETDEQHKERMQWFRDAKFGMFIHWGPCSVGKREIGWGRNAQRPWDIGVPDPSDDKYDAEYDNYYKEFNPVKFDADAWVKFAKESGMKYMVLITKHHDGFSMFDTKLSDYSIMATPFARDIVKEFVDACHKHGMKAGLYYSTRDWYHPDYMVGDNKKYDEWYRAQVEELVSNYGDVDIMWYDHVGGHDWGKWKFDELFGMMYRHQPNLIVNNRAARFCGPRTDEDLEPSPELRDMTEGDYYTPEGRIGAMDISKDWESCIHVGKGWSYRGEDGFKGPENCIKMLVSCVTGGGNLLLNFGPRPDGSFTDGESDVAKAMGEWLKKYGDAIYGTRGGPYNNGIWGGSCHKDNKLYLHVYKWSDDSSLAFDPLPRKVISARNLDGKPVSFIQDENELKVSIAAEDCDSPVTVVELTLDGPLEEGSLVGCVHMPEGDTSEYGEVAIDEDNIKLEAEGDEDPSARINLNAMRNVKALKIENVPGEKRTKALALYITDDDVNWNKVWEADEWQETWNIEVTHFHAGINVPGRQAWALKLVAQGDGADVIPLKNVTVFADPK